MSGIIWLASYPKSGNTWLRVFLANLRSEQDAPVDINALGTRHFGSRELFEEAGGWDTSELTPEELASVRMATQRYLAAETVPPFVKTHDAVVDPANGARLFLPGETHCVLYVVRNPLDVAISISHHLNQTIDEAIAFMNSPRASLDFPPNHIQVPQLLCDWSTHVRGWVDAANLPVCVLRYEDMLAAPEKTFTTACQAAGLACEPARVKQAVERSRFDRMQEQEAGKGFLERTANRVFFREGRSGGWREKLDDRQVAAITGCHGEIMRRFGYLLPDGSLPR